MQERGRKSLRNQRTHCSTSQFRSPKESAMTKNEPTARSNSEIDPTHSDIDAFLAEMTATKTSGVAGALLLSPWGGYRILAVIGSPLGAAAVVGAVTRNS